MDGSEDGGCSLNAAALEMEKYRKVDSPWRFQAETALTLTLSAVKILSSRII